MALLATVAMAGCVGAGGADDVDPTRAGGLDGGGVIEGRVTDDEARPIGGAVVAVQGDVDALQTTTVSDGSFLLEGVPPGDHVVFIQKIGFGTVGRSVKVLEGQVAILDVVLPVLPVQEPWIESLPHTGYMETGIGFVRAATCTGCADNETSWFMFGGFPEDYEGAVFEARWETEDFLGFDLLSRDEECGEDGQSSCMWYRVRSESPVHFYVERCGDYVGAPTYGRSPLPCTEEEVDDQIGTSDGDGHLETWYVGRFQEQTHLLDPACQQSYDGLPNYEQGCYGVGVAQDIRWETWVSIFHMELPPDAERYTAFPDQ